jgi:hypothetical protein
LCSRCDRHHKTRVLRKFERRLRIAPRERGRKSSKGKQVGNKEAVAAIKAHAQERAQNLRAIIVDVKAAGITSVRAIADELNRRAILTARGGRWHATSVVRLLERIAA